jgi:hypothetical protein
VNREIKREKQSTQRDQEGEAEHTHRERREYLHPGATATAW